MQNLDDALRQILNQVPQTGKETVPLAELKNRVLAEPIFSAVDLPPSDNSSVDGYAVRAADIESANPNHRVSLRLQGEVPAGKAPEITVEANACIRVFTGSFLPKGADAVLMQEDAKISQDGKTVHCLSPIRPWENIRFQGGDVKKGTLLLANGIRLRLRHLGVLAATGRAKAKAARRPQVAVLSTGRELQEPGQSLQPGAIYESNRIVLAEMTKASGGIPKIYPLVEDTLESTQKALQTAAKENDALVVSGGVSVGDYDCVRPAIQRLGGRIHFWRVRIRPGKPFVFGEVGGKPLFGLPGNPVSAVTTFMLLVRPALLKMQGATNLKPPSQKGKLAQTVSNPDDRPHFMRICWNEAREVLTVGLQSSHAVHGLSQADGWLLVNPGQTLKAGQTVSIIVWEE